MDVPADLVTPDKDLAIIVGPEPQSRNEITKKLFIYIRDHSLQDSNNQRIVNTDATLQKIFDANKTILIFDIAKYVKNHFSYPKFKNHNSAFPLIYLNLLIIIIKKNLHSVIAKSSFW